MKNKMLTYSLGFLVLAVWGLIIYKVFKAAGDDSQPVLIAERTASTETFNDYSIPKDTAALKLNYRDPFSEAKAEPVEIPVSQLVHKPVTTTLPKPVINWSIIKYSGFIQNPHSKKTLAMVSINGKEMMLSEGETNDQIKLIKNMRDSIKISYQGATKFITLNTKSQ